MPAFQEKSCVQCSLNVCPTFLESAPCHEIAMRPTGRVAVLENASCLVKKQGLWPMTNCLVRVLVGVSWLLSGNRLWMTLPSTACQKKWAFPGQGGFASLGM